MPALKAVVLKRLLQCFSLLDYEPDIEGNGYYKTTVMLCLNVYITEQCSSLFLHAHR